MDNAMKTAIDVGSINSCRVSQTEEPRLCRVYINGEYSDLAYKSVTTVTQFSVPENIADVDSFREYLRTIDKMENELALV